MEYSIQALARLAGVTTRTLRWYDQIGLLKPSRVADNGYRYYGPAEVDRLQDILYYRALGVALAQIRTCLDEPSFDRLAVLRSHLTALQGERARLEQLIRSVEATIGAMERKETMEDSKKFEGGSPSPYPGPVPPMEAVGGGDPGEAGAGRPVWTLPPGGGRGGHYGPPPPLADLHGANLCGGETPGPGGPVHPGPAVHCVL